MWQHLRAILLKIELNNRARFLATASNSSPTDYSKLHKGLILRAHYIPGTVVGFSSTTYTGTEKMGVVSVCVEVINHPSGGAIQPFSVTLLPGRGEL